MYLYLFDIDLHKTVRWPLEKMFEIQQTKQKSMTQSLLHNVCFYCIKFHVGSSGDEIISKHRDIADIAWGPEDIRKDTTKNSPGSITTTHSANG